jgi:hypothetical protein
MCPNSAPTQDDGFRKLAAGSDYYRVVQGGLATAKATAAARPELVSKVIRATLRAVRRARCIFDVTTSSGYCLAKLRPSQEDFL